MELFFRKYFWTVHLGFILLVALLSARTANLFVESALLPVPSAQVAAAAQASRPFEPPPLLEAARLAALTGLKLPEPEPAVVEPTQPEADPNAPPVKTSLRARLLGTLVASNPRWSFASIMDSNSQHSVTVSVGSNFLGAEVLEIERQRVIILNSGRREFIDNEEGSGAPPPYQPPPPVASNMPPTPGSGLGAGIRALNENEYEVPRGEIDRTLANLNDVAMQARIVPAFKDGQAQGFKLFSIRPDSIYQKIGVQNGDVIRRINGFELNSPEKALEVYTRLKEASRIEIEIERNGSTLRKTYNVR